MLELILMLLGLAFPNSNANTTTTNDQNLTTIETTQTTNSVDGDTGGEDGVIIKK